MEQRHFRVPARFGLVLTFIVVVVACEATSSPSHPASVAAAATPTPVPPGVVPEMADVPMYKVTLDRNGVHPGPGPVAKPVQAWAHAMECSAGDRTPVLAAGMLIVGCDAPMLRAVDARSGDVRWTQALAGSAMSAPSVVDGVVYVGTSGGTFDALDLASGEPIWSVQLSTIRNPVIAGGRIYVGSTDGRYLGLDTATGVTAWEWTSPVEHDDALVGTVVNGVAYVAGNENWLYAVDIESAATKWSYRGSADRFSTPAITADAIVVGQQPVSPLVALDLATGAERWRVSSPSGGQIAPPTIADGVVYASSAADGLFAIDLATGRELWNGDSGPMSGQSPAIAGSLVYLVTDRELRVFDRATGYLAWVIDLEANADASPVVSGGFVFTTDNDGTVRAFAEPGLIALLVHPAATASPAPTEAALPPHEPMLELVATFDPSTTEGLDQPSGMDIGPDGNLYVTSALTDEILVLDPEDGRVIRRWGETGSGPGQLNFLRDPRDPGSAIGGVAVAADGTVYVADTKNYRVQVFTPEGTPIHNGWGRFGTADGQFVDPIDLAVGPDGDVFVVDDQRDDIQRFGPDGAYRTTIGGHGTGDGQLNYTSSVEVDSNGTLYNADWDNHRVQAWDDAGEFLWTYGRVGDGPGEFVHPGDVAIDGRGHLFVTDRTRVQVLDAANQVDGRPRVIDVYTDGLEDAFSAVSDGTYLYIGESHVDRILKLRIVE